MASLELRNQTYRVVFMHAGKKHGFSLDTGNRQTAEALRGGVEKTLMLMSQGALRLADGGDLIEFVKSGGRIHELPKPISEVVTFAKLRDRYIAAHSNGAMEDSSLTTIRIHLKHLGETFGEKFPVDRLSVNEVQGHIDRRASAKYRGQGIGPVTIKKEVTTLRAVWNWGEAAGLVERTFSVRGLVYSKTDEKPPFMTRAEIERKLSGLSEAEAAGLWECLYLRKEEIDELLASVKQVATHPWIYPLVCTAALTGARRSELLRAEVTDVDLTAETLLVREKKRSKKQRTTRHVSLTPFLKSVLADWLADHPSGRFLFCQSGVIARSKNRSRTTGHRSGKGRASSLKGRLEAVKVRPGVGIAPISRDEAHDHLKRTLAGSKWEVLRGFHVLRHSFISCLAAAGVDQRIIDDFVGHQTDEQRKRYRHLIPDVKQKAIAGVFG